MNEETKKLIEDLAKRVAALEGENTKLRSTTTIPFDIDQAFRTRLGIGEILTLQNFSPTLVTYIPSGLLDAPLNDITAPTSGSVVDSQARTAINTIISRLESLGLIEEN